MACTKYIQTNNNIGVQFFNELDKTFSNVGTFSNDEEANKAISDLELKFYKENPIFLPKGISVGKTCFFLKVLSNTIMGGSKHIVIASAKTLTEIKSYRKKAIKSVLDI